MQGRIAGPQQKGAVADTGCELSLESVLHSTLPRRRPMESRRRAPTPARWRTHQRYMRPLHSLLEVMNHRLYPTTAGRWLVRRLERQLELHRIHIPLARGGPGLAGLRVAFLSDVHAGNFMGESDLCRLLERVARQEPDLVCLGGDLVDATAEESLLLRKPLRLIDPPLGVFAVPGNHEYAAEPDLKVFRDVISEVGARLLVNEGQRLVRNGDSLWLAGVDDLCLGRPDIELAMRGCREEEPVLLLSHHPDFFYESAWVGADLTLSGHTHGGQILLAGRTPLRHTQLGYWSGGFVDEGARLYVGRGAGVAMLPLRIGAPPEVPLLELMPRV